MMDFDERAWAALVLAHDAQRRLPLNVSQRLHAIQYRPEFAIAPVKGLVFTAATGARRSAPGSSLERSLVVTQMLFHEGRDEIVAVVVACLMAQRDGITDPAARLLE